MFVLRREHEEAFRVAGLERFAKKAVRMIKNDFELPAEGSCDLLVQVREWMTFARAFGLRTEREMYHVFKGAFVLSRNQVDITRVSDVLVVISQISRPSLERAIAVERLCNRMFDSHRKGE